MKKINSIVVTTFNHSQFIAQCIESILNQNVEDLEIIVVDDGSSDDTPLIAAKYAMEGVRLYEKVNGGPSSATNFGIDKTQGKYIFILSGDDVLLPNSITPRFEALSHPAVNIVTSVPFWINDAGRRLRGDEYQPIFSNPGLLTPLQLFEKLLFQGISSALLRLLLQETAGSQSGDSMNCCGNCRTMNIGYAPQRQASEFIFLTNH